MYINQFLVLTRGIQIASYTQIMQVKNTLLKSELQYTMTHMSTLFLCIISQSLQKFVRTFHQQLAALAIEYHFSVPEPAQNCYLKLVIVEKFSSTQMLFEFFEHTMCTSLTLQLLLTVSDLPSLRPSSNIWHHFTMA